MSEDASYTNRAATAIIEAVREEHDFGGWLARVLATAAAEVGRRPVSSPCPSGTDQGLRFFPICRTANCERLALWFVPALTVAIGTAIAATTAAIAATAVIQR